MEKIDKKQHRIPIYFNLTDEMDSELLNKLQERAVGSQMTKTIKELLNLALYIEDMGYEIHKNQLVKRIAIDNIK